MYSIVYFGSPDFSAQILSSFINNPDFQIQAVVTTPDAPIGRSSTVTPSPVALVAHEHQIPTFKPDKLDTAHLNHLKLLKADIFLVVSYGKIIPQSYLDLPRHSTLNIHFSLLPKYRGALCISEAIKNGDSETGVTLMVMDHLLDHGPVLAQHKVQIDLTDNTASLRSKLTQSAISLLKHELPIYLDGAVGPQEQDHSQATMTSRTTTHTRASSFVPWSDIAQAASGTDSLIIHNLIRSLNPDPGAWTIVPTTRGDKEIKITETEIISDKLTLKSVQISGKNPISWQSFLTGHQITS
jgi:methionyl-tRNA formyltransferase